MARPRSLLYRINRRLIASLIRPRQAGAVPPVLLEAAGAQDLATDRAPDAVPLLYVLESRSLSDLIVLDLVTRRLGLPDPLAPITIGSASERRRFFFLSRASHGWFRPNTMARYSERMVALFAALAASEQPVTGALVPVAIFWGRAPSREGSLLRLLASENWAVTSRLKRLANLFLSRNDILVHFGAPLPLAELATPDASGARMLRRAARLLRVRLRNQRVAAMGPDLSHRRTLGEQILRSRPVRAQIEQLAGTTDAHTLERRARRHVQKIASNLSYPAIRVLEHLLRWLWNRIYQGVAVHGIERVRDLAETHTLVYVPSHRSHLDYLLLSYLLYQNGLMLPHVAAGDNLDLPVLGNVLRRGGGFFMRRSFRDDPLYAAVFSEYLYQVYRRGHSVEFFPEGGRTRTGRLLPARVGLLKMTLEHHRRGIPRPLAFVPVYLGYEKLVEGASYLNELQGAAKQRESLGDLVRGLRLVRQNFGQVDVAFGRPVDLGTWRAGAVAAVPPDADEDPDGDAALHLGREIMERINASAVVNPVNLVALVTLCMPRIAIEEPTLLGQLQCYLDLLRRDAEHHDYTVTSLSPAEIVAHVESLGMLRREPGGHTPNVLSHDPVAAVLMTWYRNNVSHVLALPSLLACLVRDRRRPARTEALERMAGTVFPYISEELQAPFEPEAVSRWLDHLVRAGLLVRDGPDSVTAPAVQSPQHYQLRLLARVIMPTLERLYIVVGLLSRNRPGTLTREVLQQRSGDVARRMSRLYGLNAPEFFDARLFNQFVDALVRRGVVWPGAGGELRYAPLIDDVLKASEQVIDPDFRYAVRQEH